MNMQSSVQTLGLFLILSLLNPVVLHGENLKLKFENELMTANIDEATAKQFFELLRENRNIWYKDEKNLLSKPISLTVNNLPIIEVVKRILDKMNYALIYDEKGKLKGVVVLDKSLRKNITNNTNVILPPKGGMDSPPLGANIVPPLPAQSVPLGTNSKKPPKATKKPPIGNLNKNPDINKKESPPLLPSRMPE